MLRDSVVCVVIIRAPSDLVRMSNSIQASGRIVIPAGTLLYWELTLSGRKNADSRRELNVRALSPGSADAAVKTVIDESFAGYVNHYSYNRLLDSHLVAAGYREWAERSMSSPDAIGLVLEDGGVPVGIATARNWRDKDVLEIELAGIVSSRQGEGLYRALIDGVTREGLALGVSRIAISTQSQNLSVQRAWALLTPTENRASNARRFQAALKGHESVFSRSRRLTHSMP